MYVPTEHYITSDCHICRYDYHIYLLRHSAAIPFSSPFSCLQGWDEIGIQVGSKTWQKGNYQFHN